MSKDVSATGSETPPSVARSSPQATTASVVSSTTHNTTRTATINDADHPPDRTLWLGDLEPWMDDHYMVQVCSLFGWDTSAIHIPRPPAAPNATRHPNNAGYCLLIFSTGEKAAQVLDNYGPAVFNSAQPILLPNSNRAIKLDWLSSASARTAIGKDPGPVDSAIEYSIFVGDIAADVTNADLMNVFRNPNLGLRGDFPPRLIAPFLSCCNAKVMVDSVTGISKGYGFVRFTSEADQKRALLEMQGLYCKSRPMRLSTATAKNKNPTADEEHSEPIPVVVRVTPSIPGSSPISPTSIDPARIRSITSAVADAPSPSSHHHHAHAHHNQRAGTADPYPMMLAKIAQLSNTLGQHYPAYRSGSAAGPVLPPPGLSHAQIQQWLLANPHAKSQLEVLLGSGAGAGAGSGPGGGGGGGADGVPPSDPLNTTVFVGGLSPLISEETLRTFFAPFGAIHYVKVPPGKSCGFVQYVRKSDAERAIEALSGFSIGGSKVRLSWGRIPAAQGAAQAAVAGSAPLHSTAPPLPRPMTNQPHSNDGPLSSEQALNIVEKLVPALMAAAHHNGSAGGVPGVPLGMRAVNQQVLPPRNLGAPPQGYRDAYGYPSPIGQSPGLGYNVGGNGGAAGLGLGVGAGAGAAGGSYGRDGYGRDPYYYETTLQQQQSSPAYSYMNMNMGGMGGPMSPAMGGMGMGGYGGASASLLEDQLLGTYGGGIHRLQTSSLRPGAGGGGYGSPAAANYMSGLGAGGGGGGYGSEYDVDLGGYRSAGGGGGGQSGSFSGPPSAGGLYGGFGGMYGLGGHAQHQQHQHQHGQHGHLQNNDLAERYGAGRPTGGHFASAAGMMNGFGPVGGGGGGLNGFVQHNHTNSHAHTHGHGHGGTSPYDYTDDSSPQFQATDILRQDSTGLSYLSNNTSPGSGNANSNAASGATAAAPGKAGTGGTKTNGHVHSHGAPGSRGDGMHDLTSRFGGLGVGGAGSAPGGAGAGAGVVGKSPISPSPASGGFSSQQQHFRGDSGRYN